MRFCSAMSFASKSVFQARIYLGMINDSIEFDDDEICSQAGFFRLANFNTHIGNKELFKLIPNPSKESVKIVLNKATDGICNVCLYDVYGKKELEFNFDCKQKEYMLNLNRFAPGIYFIGVSINNNSQINKKLVIIR